MRSRNFLALVLTVSFSAFLLSSCEKGKDGDPGKPGKVNVSSHTYAVNKWSLNGSVWFANFPVSELTPKNNDSASVQVYFGVGNGTWQALPRVQVEGGNNYFMNYSTAKDTIQVQWVSNSILFKGDDPNSYYNTVSQFKVVVIPPVALKAKPDVDLRDYQAVKRAFEIRN